MKKFRSAFVLCLVCGLFASTVGMSNIFAEEQVDAIYEEGIIEETEETTQGSEAVESVQTEEDEVEEVKEVLQPFAFPDTTGDFTLEARKTIIEAGNDASFDIYLGITGSQTQYENAVLTLTLSENAVFVQDINELKIFGVLPVYNSELRTITYTFPTLQGGVFSKVSLNLLTENGVSIDGTLLEVNGTFKADGLETVPQQAFVKIAATGKVAVTNKFLSVVENPDGLAPMQGQTGVWEFGFGIPKLASGTKYLKEGSKVVVTYTIDSFGTFVGVNEGTPAPTTVEGNVLTWEFDAPTIVDQVLMEQYVFNQTFSINVKYAMETPQLHYAKNTVSGTVTFFDDTVGTQSLDGKVSIALSDDKIVPGIEGGLWPVANYGPSDSLGGVYRANGDKGIQVYDDATLGFTMVLAPAVSMHPTRDIRRYEVTYGIDDHLNISSFFTGYAYFRPNTAYVQQYPGWHPLSEDPIFDVFVKYGTKANKDAEFTLVKEGVTQNQWLYPKDFGETEEKHVTEVKFVFSKAPAGMYIDQMSFFMNVEKGYTGRVENKLLDVIIGGYDWVGSETADFGTEKYPWTPVFWEKYYSERGVEVIPMPEGQNRVLQAGVMLTQADGNIVQEGSNKVSLAIKNNEASIAALPAPLESYVLLPAGVMYDLEQVQQLHWTSSVVDSDYLGSGKQLVKVAWDPEVLAKTNYLLRPGFKINADFDVIVSEDAPTELNLKIFATFSDIEFGVPEILGTPSITDSYLEVDTNDIDGNGNTTEQAVSSGNQYIVQRNSNFVVTKSVKGDQDLEFSSMAHATAGSSVTYQLQIANQSDTKLSQLVLMDVLPSVGDSSLTTLEERGSKFTMHLNGAIQLPLEWQDKVDVTYSTSLSPNRKGVLDKYTQYPVGSNELVDPENVEVATWVSAEEVTDFSTIRSFKIELKEGVEWVQGGELNLTFDMKTPSLEMVDASILDQFVEDSERAAYNSFAFSANGSMVLEPSRVGVVLNRPVQSVHVSYITADGVELAPAEEFTGLLNEAFTLQAKEIENYVLVDVKHVIGAMSPQNLAMSEISGTFGETAQSIQFIYEEVAVEEPIVTEDPITEDPITESPTTVDTGISARNANKMYLALSALALFTITGLFYYRRKKDLK